VDRFEAELAAYVGTNFAVATSSGTSALHTALLVAGVQPGDEVLVSTLTFIAPANAIRYIGAWPVFVDADPLYWQMDPDKVVDFLEQGCRWDDGALYNKVTGRRVRAILPVHILGHACDMDPILAAAKKYDLAVIEDATETLGGTYRGRMAGHLGDIACFSFNGNKLITTGGGGMIVTDNEEWAQRAAYLTTQAKDDSIEYIHHEIGYNYRLTNIQAAMGCAQLEQLDEYLTVKRRTAGRYAEALAPVPGITIMPEAPWAASTYWLYTVLVDAQTFGIGSRDLMRALGGSGIQSRPLWQPLHRSRAHRGAFSGDCTVAEHLAQDALSLPSSVGLSDHDQTRVIQALITARESR
jgi:perosamine synthetase